jgi:hypothetical protein
MNVDILSHEASRPSLVADSTSVLCSILAPNKLAAPFLSYSPVLGRVQSVFRLHERRGSRFSGTERVVTVQSEGRRATNEGQRSLFTLLPPSNRKAPMVHPGTTQIHSHSCARWHCRHSSQQCCAAPAKYAHAAQCHFCRQQAASQTAEDKAA